MLGGSILGIIALGSRFGSPPFRGNYKFLHGLSTLHLITVVFKTTKAMQSFSVSAVFVG